MKTPITDKLYWELQGKYGNGTFEDVLPLARRLELDRAALMEAIGRFLDPADSRRNCHTELASALDAARANFPEQP